MSFFRSLAFITYSQRKISRSNADEILNTTVTSNKNYQKSRMKLAISELHRIKQQ